VLVNQYLNLKKDSAPKNHSGNQSFDITKREKQILAMIADGMGNKEIADNLGKSIRTIETHRFNIMKKLKVNNVVELLKKVEDEPGLKAFISS
jgi:DNA-binding NarL/FixJ family response regulator